MSRPRSRAGWCPQKHRRAIFSPEQVMLFWATPPCGDSRLAGPAEETGFKAPALLAWHSSEIAQRGLRRETGGRLHQSWAGPPSSVKLSPLSKQPVESAIPVAKEGSWAGIPAGGRPAQRLPFEMQRHSLGKGTGRRPGGNRAELALDPCKLCPILKHFPLRASQGARLQVPTGSLTGSSCARVQTSCCIGANGPRLRRCPLSFLQAPA